MLMQQRMQIYHRFSDDIHTHEQPVQYRSPVTDTVTSVKALTVKLPEDKGVIKPQ